MSILPNSEKNSIWDSFQKRLVIIIVVLLAFLIACLLPVFNRALIRFTDEDGLVESLGAVFFLMSSVLILLSIGKTKGLPHRGWLNFWLVCLGLVFFIAFGEEISWGQRIFDFRTPEAIREANLQGEFNLHNLELVHGRDRDGNLKTGLASWFTSHRLFYIALTGYLLGLPLIMLFKSGIGSLIRWLAIPIVPLWIGVLYAGNLIIVKAIQFTMATGNQALYHALVEIMEMNIGFVVMAAGISLLKSPQGEMGHAQ